MINGLVINGEIFFAFPHILGGPSSYMTLQLLHSEFPYIWGNFYIYILSVRLSWLTSRAFIYEFKKGGLGLSQWVQLILNKLWRSNSIFHLWYTYRVRDGKESSEPVFVNVYRAQESIPPAWRDGTTIWVVVPARHAGNRFLGSLKGLQIRLPLRDVTLDTCV